MRGFFSFWIKKKQIIQMSFVTGYIIKITFSVFNEGNNLEFYFVFAF